ncbi:MAG TPA: AMP-binding protein [Dehalococcoidia bacterium]|nr:AMP-binding protein [Dehalococcoidia bacterium]
MVLTRLRILNPLDSAESSETHDADGAPMTIPALVEQARQEWGAKIAFQQKIHREWTRYSHHDIYERSHELAAGLVALGVQQGDRVALVLENSIEWICSFYAIVLTGAIAVPMYYELKPDEIEAMIAHTQAKVGFTSGKVLSKLAPAFGSLETLITAGEARQPQGDRNHAVPDELRRRSEPERLDLEDLPGRATDDSWHELRGRLVRPDDVASIVFTSGTTGGMKGVMLTHRNFMANCRSIRKAIPFGDRDRLIVVLPMHHAFPFTITAIVAPAVGGEVTFENDLRRIRDRMAEIKPTLFTGVPALFELMYRNVVQRIEAEGRLETFERGLRICDATKQRTGINIGRIVFRELHKRLGGRLRFMISGGAALNPQVARDFARLGIPILQGWGLTEAAPVLSVQRWNPRRFYMSNYYEERVGMVGQPLDGVEIQLIDVPEKELYVHLHGEGELVARGENITPGYWQSDEATRAQKVGEWLRTGDVGRFDDEGNIWITGRSKYVIVLDSGEKVHPDEIEEALASCELLEDVAVIPRKVRGKTQVAVVGYPNREAVLEKLMGRIPDPEELRTLVRDEIDRRQAKLASYKRVGDVTLTDTPLPKTALRKVARGQIAETYSFELDRWAQSWRELQDAAIPGASEPDDEQSASA